MKPGLTHIFCYKILTNVSGLEHKIHINHTRVLSPVCKLEKWMNWVSSSKKIGSLPEEQVTGQHRPLKACNQPLVAHTLQQWLPPEQHPSWSTDLPKLDPLSLLPSPSRWDKEEPVTTKITTRALLCYVQSCWSC